MKSVEFLQNRIDSLKAQLANGLSEEAKAEVSKTIAGLEAAINEIKELQAAAEQDNEDKSAELMSQVKEIVARVQAVENQLKNHEPQKKMNKISDTKEYEKKFFDMVQNSLNRDEFRKNLKQLAVENSIAITEGSLADLLPAAVLQEVNDIFVGRRHRLLELVDWTGLPAFKALFETGNEQGKSWPSVMLGQDASEAAKQNQNLTFTKYVIRPQYLYKKIALDKDMIRASEADGSVFIRYIVRELLDRLLTTVECAILQGGSENGGSFPNNASFFPPAEVEGVQINNKPQYHAINYLPYSSSESLVAIVKPSEYIRLKQELAATYGYYITDDFMARDFFGVSEVLFTPPGFVEPENWTGFMFMNPRAYKLVGDRRPDQYEDFNLEWNRMDYLMEMWIGGGSITGEFVTVTFGNVND